MKKTKRDVALLTDFLQTKGETRSEIVQIPPAELNELLSEFILRVPTKEGQDYQPLSLRGMVTSFERHLQRKLHDWVTFNDSRIYDIHDL